MNIWCPVRGKWHGFIVAMNLSQKSRANVGSIQVAVKSVWSYLSMGTNESAQCTKRASGWIQRIHCTISPLIG